MKCEMCGVNDATVHVRQIMGNKAVDVHLCDECAAKSGITEQDSPVDLTVAQLLTGLMESGVKEAGKTEERICPVCGLSIRDFRKTGKTGCPECYDFFRQDILAMLENVSGFAWHRGKLPKKLKTYKTLMVDKQILKQQLKEAVEKEDYEGAAALRDRIRSLEETGEERE